MIRVIRTAPPAYLNPSSVAQWTKTLCDKRRQYYQDLAQSKRPPKSAPPRRPKADGNHYGHPDVRDELEIIFGPKCAYCEGHVAALSPQHVEHYRPASRYPALAYKWDNLLLACPHCNVTYKSDSFPIAPAGNTLGEHRRRPCARTEAGETAFLLNPCIDDPDRHLTFREGYVVALTERGHRTRRLCRLNRTELVRLRRSWLNLIRLSADGYLRSVAERDLVRQARYADALREFVQPQAQFATMVRTELTLKGINWRTL